MEKTFYRIRLPPLNVTILLSIYFTESDAKLQMDRRCPIAFQGVSTSIYKETFSATCDFPFLAHVPVLVLVHFLKNRTRKA